MGDFLAEDIDEDLTSEETKLKEDFRNYIEVAAKGALAKVKFQNINGKTSQYYVHEKLFQDRCARYTRVLIPFKYVVQNELKMKHLERFKKGAIVEFVNDDIIKSEYKTKDIHKKLRKKIGSDDNVSAIISFRSEDGNPGAEVAAKAFEEVKKALTRTNDWNIAELIPLTRKKVIVDGEKVGYRNLHNNHWEGNCLISIKGGKKETIEKPSAKKQIFNPAIEYANSRICFDIEMVLAYYALHCHDAPDEANGKKTGQTIKKSDLIKQIENYLKTRKYPKPEMKGENLLEHCKTHITMSLIPGKLVDPIQVTEISIKQFNNEITPKEEQLHISHMEAAQLGKFVWDAGNDTILSAARPTNLYWSTHLSNMMQQHFTIDEFWKHIEKCQKAFKEASK